MYKVYSREERRESTAVNPIIFRCFSLRILRRVTSRHAEFTRRARLRVAAILTCRHFRLIPALISLFLSTIHTRFFSDFRRLLEAAVTKNTRKRADAKNDTHARCIVFDIPASSNILSAFP